MPPPYLTYHLHSLVVLRRAAHFSRVLALPSSPNTPSPSPFVYSRPPYTLLTRPCSALLTQHTIALPIRLRSPASPAPHTQLVNMPDRDFFGRLNPAVVVKRRRRLQRFCNQLTLLLTPSEGRSKLQERLASFFELGTHIPLNALLPPSSSPGGTAGISRTPGRTATLSTRSPRRRKMSVGSPARSSPRRRSNRKRPTPKRSGPRRVGGCGGGGGVLEETKRQLDGEAQVCGPSPGSRDAAYVTFSVFSVSISPTSS